MSQLPFLETSDIAEIQRVLKTLDPSATVFLDVDDTLITPKSKFFRHQSPYRMLIDDIKKDPDAYPHADQIISTWRLQRKTQLVSAEWPSFITQLKETHPVYALTRLHSQAFGTIPSMEKWRHEELNEKGISFTPGYKGEQNVILAKDGNHPFAATFYKGIFITGSYKKSEVLQAFLKENKPSQIVLIDDRIDHLEDALKECERQGISFTGILYRGVERLNGIPNPKVAKIQRKHLLEAGEWLEDGEAKALL